MSEWILRYDLADRAAERVVVEDAGEGLIGVRALVRDWPASLRCILLVAPDGYVKIDISKDDAEEMARRRAVELQAEKAKTLRGGTWS